MITKLFIKFKNQFFTADKLCSLQYAVLTLKRAGGGLYFLMHRFGYKTVKKTVRVKQI